MQQLKIEHKNIKKDRRPGKGRAMALSRRIYRLQNTDTVYYVESETSDNHYYFVKYNFSSVVESGYCSCKDNSTRYLKCKHLFAIEFAIKWGTIKDIADNPLTLELIKRHPTVVQQSNNNKKSYLEDDYDF